MVADPQLFAGTSDYALLNEAIESSKPYYESRAEIIDWYKKEYGTVKGAHGTEAWITHIVKDRHDLEPDRKLASIQREFQFDSKKGHYRYQSKESPASKERYQLLGMDKLPRRKKQAHVKFKGKIYYSKGKSRRKTFDDLVLSEDQTTDMLDGNFDPILEAYGLETRDIEGVEVESIEVWF